LLANLLDGFVRAMSLTNLGFLVFGGTLGTILGMLPGLGPATGVAVLLPLTFILEPDTAMITLSAIYYGAMFGGLVIGISQELSTMFISASYKPGVAFAIMIIMLLVKPSGLMGRKV